LLSTLSIITAGVVGMAASPAGAVSGAAFTTFNAHVDGSKKDVCKNSAINCNIYGAKEYVWLNGGPTANGLGPDGEYFFAVLVPGGQPDPNDGGFKNLSDDYDAYTNRTFTVTDGEVSAYSGTHWLDSGQGGPKPNGDPPYIRLFPYADTTNPGGVYIMAICSLEDGYPVEPRDCKYDAFKVKKGKMPISFRLEGYKFEDMYCDGGCEDEIPADPGLPGWKIIIDGTGPDGLPFHAEVFTDASGYWFVESGDYFFGRQESPVPLNLTVCEVPVDGWTQSCPASGCYTITDSLPEPSYTRFAGLNFGNWRPVTVTGCIVRAPEADCSNCEDGTPVEGWSVSLTEEGVVVDTQLTDANGCYEWAGLECGITYDLHDEGRDGWDACGPSDIVFDRSQSGDSFDHTFCNVPLQGCTPGFWQGGPDQKEDHAGGQWLWNEVNDPQWTASGGMGTNPYIHTTLFNDFFTPYPGLDGYTMMDLVNTGGTSYNPQKAGRSLVAAYLNASWGMGYAYTTTELAQLWEDTLVSEDFLGLHPELDAANNAYYRDEAEAPRCPISASGY